MTRFLAHAVRTSKVLALLLMLALGLTMPFAACDAK